MQLITDIIYTLSKLSKTCILRICEDRLYFIVPDSHSMLHRISVWTILSRDEFFSAYVMNGETETNEIVLEFSSGI